jgi:U4/U6.U5 tri-snRNP-associated protein 2
MGAEEQPSPTRKRGREDEELADGGAAEKRPRAEGESLLGLASYEDDDEEEAARGQANGRGAEGEEVEDDDDEEDDARRAPERRPRQVELRRDCPYLDTVNRQVHLHFKSQFGVP